MEWIRNDDKIEGRGKGFVPRYLEEDAEMENFTGTHHCETTMMALFLLEKDYDKIVDLEANIDPKDPDTLHLRLPPRGVAAQFKDSLDVLQVSKRFCLACFALVRHITGRRGKADMIHPGNHARWYPITLPSFIEAGAGRAVLNAAKKALQSRILDILKVIRMEKASPACSHASAGSPIDPTS